MPNSSIENQKSKSENSMSPSLRTVTATRYVTPLREGGSLPAIVEADDDGLYVLKFRGAGQGAKSLIAELVAGEIARASGLPIPELVFVELDPELARTEPDPEIQDLIRASAGLNLALDYLPGSITFDPVAGKSEADLASEIVWFDAFATNIDRTPRNANMLVWHRRLWLIDHGAAMYFHHTWKDYRSRSRDRFPAIKDHVLLRFASTLEAADLKMTQMLTADIIRSIVKLIPDSWLVAGSPFSDSNQHRDAYTEYLLNRLESPHIFLEEAISARSMSV
ncbi:aminotransferase class I and II [Microcoleus sp. A006_D1]|uniref:HipA family kinase n=1 Tax=Microcoleus sp. A006_D1 TaxID=3055267 RepID=UPI002FD70D60